MAYGDLDRNLEILYRMVGIVAQENILGLLRDDDRAFYEEVASTGRLIACSEVDWKEFPGNKIYLEGVPPELPRTGGWKYRLPINYNKSLGVVRKNSSISFNNVKSISVVDEGRGTLKEGQTFYVVESGDVWVKGNQPYANLFVQIEWNDEGGNKNISKIRIKPEEFIINGTKISTSTQRVRVPYRPCFDGVEVKYQVNDYALVFYKKVCFADETILDGRQQLKPGIQKKSSSDVVYVSSSIEVMPRIITEYIDQRPNRDLINCECIEFTTVTPPTVQRFITPDCDCTLTISEETYLICPDAFTDFAYNQYLNGRKTPPTIDDLINKSVTIDLEPQYRRLISADPCDFGNSNSRVMQRFASRDIRNTTTNYIDGLFTSMESLDCFTTSSIQPSETKEYYYDVTECGSCDVSASYFSVSFGHYAGSGSLFEEYEDNDSPSRSVYSQYKLIALDNFSDDFSYYNNGLQTSSMFYVMNFYRNAMKDRIDPGNFEISLAELNGLSYQNKYYTGSNVAVSSSNKVLQLIDNSGDLTEGLTCSSTHQVVSFDIVSGSLRNGIHSSGTGSYDTNSNIKTYGKVYPNLGVIVLDAKTLDNELNFNSVTGSNLNGDNSYKIFTSLSGSTALGLKTKFRNSKRRDTTHYSVRISPVECNYSSNPTFVKADGRLRKTCFIHHPVTYITTVGLYNDANDLLAIAKLSKPIKKTPDDTVDIKIRLGR